MAGDPGTGTGRATVMRTKGSRHRNRSSATPIRRGWGAGATIGLITAGVAIGVAELVAAFVGELASPVVAVGEAAIDLAPPAVKDFAINTFGAHDKLVLLVGIGVLLGLFALVTGMLAVRRHWVGYVGLIVFGGIGLLAAITRPTADSLSALPSVVGVAAGCGALSMLLRSTETSSTEASRRSGAAGRRGAGSAVASGRGTTERGQLVAFDRRRFLVTGVAL